MTDWSLTDEDAFDFLDPNDPTSSPVHRSPGTPVGGASVPTTTADELDPADASDAVSDSAGAIHVWVDDERRVLHVRLSNRWRDRLGKDTALDQAVLAVIRRAQTRMTPGLDIPRATEDVVAMSRNEASLDYLLERSMLLRDRRRKLAVKPAEDVRRRTVVGVRPVGHDGGRHVSVTIDAYANTHAITLDAEWLPSAQTADLGSALVEAHQAAYAQWSPPVVEPGEYEELAREGELIAGEAAAMLRRGA